MAPGNKQCQGEAEKGDRDKVWKEMTLAVYASRQRRVSCKRKDRKLIARLNTAKRTMVVLSMILTRWSSLSFVSFAKADGHTLYTRGQEYVQSPEIHSFKIDKADRMQ